MDLRGTVVSLALIVLGAAHAASAQAVSASYSDPTGRYPHGALGDSLEWGAVTVRMADGREIRMTLPETRVFEDTEPRLADVDGDGSPEIITVESDHRQGARLSIWRVHGGRLTLLAATPFIGTRNRWLAPVGIADMDGDGRIELAYVDRPHLARTLRVWRYVAGRLIEVAAVSGISNHRFGEPFISGGLRDCGDGTEMITATADWRQIVASRLVDDRIESRVLGPNRGNASFAFALNCL